MGENPFTLYLDRRLSAFDVDAAVYTPYIQSLAEAGAWGDLGDLLGGVGPDDPQKAQDWQEFVSTIKTVFEDPGAVADTDEPVAPSSAAGLDMARKNGVLCHEGWRRKEDIEGQSSAVEYHNEGCSPAKDLGHEDFAVEDSTQDLGCEESPSGPLSGVGDYIEELEAAATEVLCSIFPTCAPTALLCALSRCGYDVSATVKCVDAALSQPSKPMCRYFLAGHCARADCMFSHSTRSTCLYWLQGGCFNEACSFLHDFVPPGNAELSVSEASLPHTPPPRLEEFPALVGNQQHAMEGSQSQIVAKSSLRDLLRFMLPPTTAVGAEEAARHSQSDGELGTSFCMSYESTSSGANWSGGLRKRLEDIWSEGGENVRALYERARQGAAAVARARNILLMNATDAYKRGDKATATALSRKGRALDFEMRERHKEAALAIFSSLNQPLDGVFKDGLIDLHGMHVSEAQEILNVILHDIQSTSHDLRQIIIITGSGHHSGGYSGGKSKLLPAVETYLRQNGYDFRSLEDRRGYKGAFMVALRNSRA